MDVRLTIGWAKQHVAAILEAWYPGEFGGRAIAETLFGDNNPSGRLTITFPHSVGQLPDFYNSNPSRVHKYVDDDGKPLFPFGFGLSYTSFHYDDIAVQAPAVGSDADVVVSFQVTNTGEREGTEVPQLYVRQEVGSVETPERSLEGFTRIHLKPNESRTVTMHLRQSQLAVWNAERTWADRAGLLHRMGRRIVGSGTHNALSPEAVMCVGRTMKDRDRRAMPLQTRTRRTILWGRAALLLGLSGNAALGATAKHMDPVDYVSPNIGGIGQLLTATVPYVQTPHGMARLAPVTTPGINDRYLADKIYGFPAGPAMLMASSGKVSTQPKDYASNFDHDFETTTPYYYEADLQSWDIKAEVTATQTAAYYRFTLPAGSANSSGLEHGGQIGAEGCRRLRG